MASPLPFVVHKKSLSFLRQERGGSLLPLSYGETHALFLNHIRFLNFALLRELVDKSISYIQVSRFLDSDLALLEDENALEVHSYLIQHYPATLFKTIEERRLYFNFFSRVRSFVKPLYLSLPEDHLKTVSSDFRNAFEIYASFLYGNLGLRIDENPGEEELQKRGPGPRLLLGSPGRAFPLHPFVVLREGRYYLWEGRTSLTSFSDEAGETVDLAEAVPADAFFPLFRSFLVFQPSLSAILPFLSPDQKRCMEHLSSIREAFQNKNYNLLLKNINAFKRDEKSSEPFLYLLDYFTGLSYFHLERYSQSVLLLESLLRVAPELYFPYLLLIDIFFQTNNPSRVLQLGEKIKKILLSSEILKKYETLQENASGQAPIRKAEEPKGSGEKDLTDLRERVKGLFEPILGREKEAEQIVEISLCLSRCNTLLVGDPGVGKSSVINRFVQKILENQVPESLLSLPVFELNTALLFSGAKFRGQLEEKLIGIFSRLEEKGALLVVEDIHSLVGGDGRSGIPDFSSLLKPFLERGKLRVLATTSYEECLKTLDKIPLFSHLFQRVDLAELSLPIVAEILHSKAENLSNHHHTVISMEEIVPHLELVKQFFRDRLLPDKAIELLDRTCARASLGFHRRKMDLPEVHGIDFLQTLADTRGVELSSISLSLQERLKNLETRLRSRIVGQDDSLGKLVKKLLPLKAGLKLNPLRPDGIFLFLGPTGVGKTETAKVLAKELFGDEKKLLRIDMSEYMEEYTVSRLIGAAPGYVGYSDTNQFTDEIKRDPYKVVLLDEIEKAHPQVLNLFLQVFDSGVLTDSRGKKAYFDKAVIIMTSNVGTALFSQVKMGFSAVQGKSSVTKSELGGELKRFFRPEFLNRIDEILFFNPLAFEDIREIVSLKLNDLNTVLERDNLSLRVDDGAIDYLARKSFQPEYGAREVNRIIEGELLQKVALLKLFQEEPFQRIAVSWDGAKEALVLTPEAAVEEEMGEKALSAALSEGQSPSR